MYKGITASDFRQHYEGGWGLASLGEYKDDRSVINIGGIAEGSSSSTRFTVATSIGDKGFVFNPTEVNLEFPQPKTGLYNIKGMATNVILVRKSAEKQFRKAFGSGHYHLVFPLLFSLRQWCSSSPSLFLDVVNVNRTTTARLWSREIVSSIFFPQYPNSWDTVVNTRLGVEKSEIMCALSLDWMLVESRVSQYKFEVYHGAFPVGYVLPNNNNKVYIQRLYKQEFVDFITRNKFNVEVSEIK